MESTLPRIQCKIKLYTKSHKNMVHFKWRRQSTDANPKVLELSDQDLKATILKVTILNEAKGNMLTGNQNIRNLQKCKRETDFLNKNI